MDGRLLKNSRKEDGRRRCQSIPY